MRRFDQRTPTTTKAIAPAIQSHAAVGLRSTASGGVGTGVLVRLADGVAAAGVALTLEIGVAVMAAVGDLVEGSRGPCDRMLAAERIVEESAAGASSGLRLNRAAKSFLSSAFW